MITTDLVLSLSKLFLGVLEGSRGEGGELAPKGTVNREWSSSAMLSSLLVVVVLRSQLHDTALRRQRKQ